ncbi:MAG: SDR family oxidoreductase [Planctomycetaceae bacterium]|nr:SDR family oxidoreductase [Planctomycetaceae bacterium]
MDYLLLSGASGLLGTYLMHDLMSRGVKLAVLVRSNRMASAAERIETQINFWEKQLGHTLPRPVVLEGDLSSPTLGLSDADLKWVERNCKAFMHNAASLTFYAKDEVGEPWRSNREGTRNVLAFCKERGIREFHHVSTAYVCGKRRGEVILEADVDVGQEPGNDYEQSKLESEVMVRSADFIDSLTVYRPAIIVGDAKTGYTTTYHGFYVPLKLIATLLSKVASGSASQEMIKAGIRMGSVRLQQALNVSGEEQKNFVPVDWVSACMTEIYCNEANHGQTYHLTPRNTVPTTIFQKVWEEIFFEFNELPKGENSDSTINFDEFESYFVNQMKTYQSYWGDDPRFDYSNTQKACPNLPCPTIDEEMMRNLCRFAIKDNFGWPKPPVVKPAFTIDSFMREKISVETSAERIDQNDPDTFTVCASGAGGGEWVFKVEGNTIISAERGVHSKSKANLCLNMHTFLRLTQKEVTVEETLQNGQLLVEGADTKDAVKLFKQLIEGESSTTVNRLSAVEMQTQGISN